MYLFIYFLSTGLSGLEELKAINPVFKRYERTLFDSSSVNLVRSVETVETNKKLDEEINKFLIHCSPHFLLNPAHKALEWLIQRLVFKMQIFLLVCIPFIKL